MLTWSLATILCAVASVTVAKDSVRVKDFGFDPADSTRFVQAALDSGARTVYLDRLSRPWVVTPLEGRSNTELVFVDGAELVAKKNAFKAKQDSLLTFRLATNVVVRGEGAPGVMRMYIDDYLDKSRYERSEWRHGLRLFSVCGARVENMVIRETGGDGIIVSKAYGTQGAEPSRDVVVCKCVLDGNLRQGVSIITADGFLMTDSVMSNTRGLNPMAGIDVEQFRATFRMAAQPFVVGFPRWFGPKYQEMFLWFFMIALQTGFLVLWCKARGTHR